MVTTYVWIAVVASAGLICARAFIARWRRDRWPSIAVADIFVAVSIFSVVFFSAAQRSDSTEYRYLISTAWAFPFLIGHLYARIPRRHAGRRILGGLAIALALANVTNAVALGRTWNAPGFAAQQIQRYDLAPAIDYIASRGISRCYASYGISYRMTYESDERIVCSQIYNERFFGWQLPYKALVDASTNVAVVASPGRHITPEHFEEDMRKAGVTMRKQVCGALTVYTDFEGKRLANEVPVSPALLRVDASHNAAQAPALIDGKATTAWRSLQEQAPGMWIDVQLASAMRIHGLILFTTFLPNGRATAVDVMTRSDGAWTNVTHRVPYALDDCEFRHGHPVYGARSSTIRFAPLVTDNLRVVLAKPHSPLNGLPNDWAIGELMILGDREDIAMPLSDGDAQTVGAGQR
jgi:hypothetical protein